MLHQFLLLAVALTLLAAAAPLAHAQDAYPMRLPAVVPEELAGPAGSGPYAGERYPIGPAVYGSGYDAADPFTRRAIEVPPVGPSQPIYTEVPPEAAMADIYAHVGTAHLPPDVAEHRYRVLPEGVLWKGYLASPKESRISATFIDVDGDSEFMDGTLGGRFALFRMGNGDSFFPEGLEFDIEASAQVRLDLPEDVDLRSADFRAGGFFAWGDRWRQTKFGYYHISSHTGDEFLIKNTGYPRLNFARDCLIIAQSIYLAENFRVYAEADWAFWSDVSENWEFQFGAEWAPTRPTGPLGAPFAAVHGHLREELNYSGNVVFQTGWAWVGDESRNLFRIGLHYYNGSSSQYSFYNQFEEQIGIGFWFER